MNLLNFLKTNKNTRKIFGERELKIIEKQFNGINLTQSEKNRLSRDIRKKFEFIKEASKFEEDFNIKKGEFIKDKIKNSLGIILEDISFPNIKNIWIYGSVVENKMTPKSDIDLAVEFYNIDLKESTLFRKRILGRVNSLVDIQVFNILPKKIQEEIKSKGKILYKK